MACATLYQCFNFLARHNGVLSLTTHPNDPCKNRFVIRVSGKEGEDDVLATAEYDCTEEHNLHSSFTKICAALQEQVE